MKNFKILLKKDYRERLSNLKNTKKDITGVVLSVLLTIFVVGIFVFAFSYFTNTYSSVKIGYLTNKVDRVFEILTIFYMLLFILLTFMGIFKLNKNLVDSGNLTLLSMPITPFQIFMSKIFGVYTDLAFTSLVISLPVFMLLIIQGLLNIGTIFLAILFAALIPFMALFMSSIFTIPFYFLRRWLNRHVVVQLITYCIFMIGAFLVYSIFLHFIKGLMESGQITFFFNQETVLKISKLCKYIFPINIFSSLIMGRGIVLNILLLTLFLVGSIAGCFFIGKSIFTLVQHNKIGTKNDVIVKKPIKKIKGKTISLMGKEFLNVLRTPSYAFNYFAIILSLPLMVVITSSLMSSMMQELTLLNCNFEIVLCAISMYSIVLNSFCANNISRDGKFLNLLKTFPIGSKRVVFSKILFCSITTFISIIISGIAVIISGIISPIKVFAVIIICCALNFGVICLATRKDLNTTKNKIGDENISSTNFLIFWGLIFSVCLTVVSFVISLYLQTRFNLLVSNLISSAVIFGMSMAVVGISLIYLLKNLDEKFKEIIL